MDRLVQIDQQISLWLNQHNPEALNGFWHVLSGIREWIPLYVLILAALMTKVTKPMFVPASNLIYQNPIR